MKCEHNSCGFFDTTIPTFDNGDDPNLSSSSKSQLLIVVESYPSREDETDDLGNPSNVHLEVILEEQRDDEDPIDHHHSTTAPTLTPLTTTTTPSILKKKQIDQEESSVSHSNSILQLSQQGEKINEEPTTTTAIATAPDDNNMSIKNFFDMALTPVTSSSKVSISAAAPSSSLSNMNNNTTTTNNLASPRNNSSALASTAVSSNSISNSSSNANANSNAFASFSFQEGVHTELDFDTHASELYLLLQRRDWHGAAQRLKTHREEATYWISRKEVGAENKLRWRLLPIHGAIIFCAPDFMVKSLLEAFPISVAAKDDQGMLPLHLSYRMGSPAAVIEVLLTAFPESLTVKDRKGRTPLVMAHTAKGPNRAVFLRTIEKAQQQAQQAQAQQQAQTQAQAQAQAQAQQQAQAQAQAQAQKQQQLQKQQQQLQKQQQAQQQTQQRQQVPPPSTPKSSMSSRPTETIYMTSSKIHGNNSFSTSSSALQAQAQAQAQAQQDPQQHMQHKPMLTVDPGSPATPKHYSLQNLSTPNNNNNNNRFVMVDYEAEIKQLHVEHFQTIESMKREQDRIQALHNEERAALQHELVQAKDHAATLSEQVAILERRLKQEEETQTHLASKIAMLDTAVKATVLEKTESEGKLMAERDTLSAKKLGLEASLQMLRVRAEELEKSLADTKNQAEKDVKESDMKFLKLSREHESLQRDYDGVSSNVNLLDGQLKKKMTHEQKLIKQVSELARQLTEATEDNEKATIMYTKGIRDLEKERASLRATIKKLSKTLISVNASLGELNGKQKNMILKTEKHEKEVLDAAALNEKIMFEFKVQQELHDKAKKERDQIAEVLRQQEIAFSKAKLERENMTATVIEYGAQIEASGHVRRDISEGTMELKSLIDTIIHSVNETLPNGHESLCDVDNLVDHVVHAVLSGDNDEELYIPKTPALRNFNASEFDGIDDEMNMLLYQLRDEKKDEDDECVEIGFDSQ